MSETAPRFLLAVPKKSADHNHKDSIHYKTKLNSMKNLDLSLGKKLNKKQLRVITGGKEMCLLPDLTCKKYSFTCAEIQCQPGIEL